MSLSTSLAEARQLYALLSDIETQLEGVDRKVKQTDQSYRDLYNVMQDVFAILRHSGLPEDQVRALAMIQRLITTTYSLIVALNALNVAMATTPAGIAVAAVGFGATFLSTISMIGSYG